MVQRYLWTFRNLLCAYPRLFHAVKSQGRIVSPRGNEVMEHCQPIIWNITKPWEYILAIPGRRINIFFALAEVVWMWSGKGGAEFITYYNQSMKQFLDEGMPYFHGAYGRRVRHSGYSERPFRELPYLISPGDTETGTPEPVEIDQLHFVISKLQGDIHTRQACVSLWDVIKDNFVTSKDHPCNNMLYFSQRDGALNLTVVIRSNDLVWGVPYNMCQFSHLQALIAGSLGLAVGSFHVMCNNLHYYTGLYPGALTKVSGWCENVETRRLNLEKWSDRFYGQPTVDMTWALDYFDQFVAKIWEPMEREMRDAVSYNQEGEFTNLDPFFFSKLKDVDGRFEQLDVPDYWRHVFHVLLMFHCRKGEAFQTYDHILQTLPPAMKWAVQDFTSK